MIGPLLLTLVTQAALPQTACRDTTSLVTPEPLPTSTWIAEDHARIAELITALGAQSKSYDPCRRPLAVLAVHGVLTRGDLGRDAFRAGVKRKVIMEDHRLPCVKPDCDDWPARAFAGLDDKALALLAAEVPATFDARAASLIRTLQTSGWDVFLVTSAPQWLIEAKAAQLGLSRAQVIGTQLRTTPEDGRSDQVKGFEVRGAGKIAAIRSRIAPGGRKPALAVGGTDDDLRMLLDATHLGVVTSTLSVQLQKMARARGWVFAPTK